MAVFIGRLQEFADEMPETALVNQPTGTPANESESPSSAASAAMTVAGAFGGATKGLAGWAVSSINARFNSPSGNIEAPVQRTSAENRNGQSTSNVSLAAVESRMLDLAAAEADNSQDGWDNESPGDLLAFDENEGWEPFEGTVKEEPEPITSIIPPIQPNAARVVSSFPSAEPTLDVNKPSSGMKLGHKTKSFAFESEEVGQNYLSTEASNPVSSKEDRKAELERRREERRQRMAELREKKKGGIGAKKIGSQ
ncbi:hypothetical protein EC973_005452 [Apophysomyces ossiformis]|uniref:Uncharacterized protein n=1 Tax=Apophysomyces ossiformis TaxID=679940 RepID=A0A8H7BX34_9FUNG|nr:hypothetical protein EC973_005452 [Apophysomyces ossiformis]